MRFQVSTIFAVAFASLAIAQPINLEARAKDGLLQKVGGLVAGLEKALGVTAVEDALDKALDGKLVSSQVAKMAPILAFQTDQSFLSSLFSPLPFSSLPPSSFVFLSLFLLSFHQSLLPKRP